MIIYYSNDDELYIATFKYLDLKASGETVVEAAKNLIKVSACAIEMLEEEGRLESYLIKHECVLSKK